MGMPKDLSPSQIEQMQRATSDAPEIGKTVQAAVDGTLNFSLPMNSNDIVLVRLTSIPK
jgi:xylan 1,4-beta-xylosidase